MCNPSQRWFTFQELYKEFWVLVGKNDIDEISTPFFCHLFHLLELFITIKFSEHSFSFKIKKKIFLDNSLS